MMSPLRYLLPLIATLDLVKAQTLDIGATAAPGAATVPPGTVPPGTVPPGTVPPGTVPPVAVAVATTSPQAPVDDGWSGCVDPSNPEELVRIGKKTTICVVLASSTTWNTIDPTTQYLRLSFQPAADEYARFHVPESYKDLVVTKATSVHDGSNNVTIHVASQKVLSFQRIFYSPNMGAGKVYPFLTAIIDVQKGVVKGITWDDSCLFCADKSCEENTYDFNGNMGTQEEYGQPTKGCYIEQGKCSLTSVVATVGESKPACDINVYVVWTGDDADGRALQSSAFRFSAFPKQEIQNRIDDLVPDVPDLGLGSVFGGGDETSEQDGS